MITPIWTDTNQDLPLPIRTRCKLEYSDTSVAFVNDLISEFEKLPKTVLFALRQLRELNVVLENVQGRDGRLTICRQTETNTREMIMNTNVVGQFGEHRSSTTRPRLFQRVIPNLPFEKSRKGSESTVTIAFEVDLHGHPVVPLRGQHVFAFLPVQRLSQLPVRSTILSRIHY